MQSTPVCIIGAGPAGTTASLFLSKMGINHTIIEKEVFPRDKICGDGIDATCIRVMNTLDPSLVQEILANPIQFNPAKGIKIISPKGYPISCYHKPTQPNIPEPFFFVSKRIDFDSFLYSKINTKYANLHAATTATNIERVDGGIVVTYSKDGVTNKVFTNLLLAADGDHSIVLRKLNLRKIDRNYYAASLRMYCKNVAGIDKDNLLEFYFLKDMPSGYFWIFPLANNECNVGMGLNSNYASKNNFNLRKEFDNLLANDPIISPRFANAERLESPKGWGIPMAGGKRELVGDNYLLLGDAGSLINPLTGEGIGNGMISGWAAAQYAKRAIDKNDFSASFLKPYQHQATYRLKSEINFYNYIEKKAPGMVQRTLLNSSLLRKVIKNQFEKSARQWMNTAFNIPLTIKG